MKELPLNVNAYKKTPEFDEESVPSGLLNEHRTKESVWGKMGSTPLPRTVLKGSKTSDLVGQLYDAS